VIVITDERCADYSSPGHPERPERITRTAARLRAQEDIPVTWERPGEVRVEQLLRVHAPEHLQRLGDPEGDFDGDTPSHPGIMDHAMRSVGGALAALGAARSGKVAFSLLRPPGHHATRTRAMGFCYLSSIAITVLDALATGIRRVAVLDFDVHHGNGTEAILAGTRGACFASIHQYPCYPGTGTSDVSSNCYNYPVPPKFPRGEYRQVITRALERLLANKPDLLAVSAGFDAYVRDPIAHETLEEEDFHWLGECVRKTGLPAFSILEGGYSSDLPDLVLAYLKGIRGI
jgi:acetoin utilization deacetylase AcuC-like enzyme